MRTGEGSTSPGGIEICSLRMDNRSTAGQSGVSSPQRRRQRIKSPVADIFLLGNSVSNVTAISQIEALPGDIALYPDASHVGIIVGRNGLGTLLVCRCSYGMNNVAVTKFTAFGFTDVGRHRFMPG